VRKKRKKEKRRNHRAKYEILHRATIISCNILKTVQGTDMVAMEDKQRIYMANQ